MGTTLTRLQWVMLAIGLPLVGLTVGPTATAATLPPVGAGGAHLDPGTSAAVLNRAHGSCGESNLADASPNVEAAEATLVRARSILDAAQADLQDATATQPSHEAMAQARYAVELAITRVVTAGAVYARHSVSEPAASSAELARSESVDERGPNDTAPDEQTRLAVAITQYDRLKLTADPVLVQQLRDAVASAEVSYSAAEATLDRARLAAPVTTLPCTEPDSASAASSTVAGVDLGQGSAGATGEPVPAPIADGNSSSPAVSPTSSEASPALGAADWQILGARLNDPLVVWYVWVLNGALLTVLVLVAAGLMISAMAASALGRRRRASLQRASELLAGLVGKDDEAASRGAMELATSLSLDEILDLTERRQAAIPELLHEVWRDALWRAKVAQAIEILAQRSGGDALRRVRAGRCLEFLRSTQTEAILRQSLEDANPIVSAGAIVTVAGIKVRWSARVLADCLSRQPAAGQRIVGLLEAHPPGTIDVVRPLLVHRDARVRTWVVRLLTRLRATRCADEVAALAHDSDPDVRAATCDFIGQLGLNSGEPVLLGCLGDDAWFVRLHAVRSLGSQTGATHIDRLAAMFEAEQSVEVKRAIKHILGNNFEQTLQHIERWLEQSDRATRQCCVDLIHEVDYLSVMLDHILYGDASATARATRVLEALIRSDVYFGLKRTLEPYNRIDQLKILELVNSIDQNLGAQLSTAATRS